MDYSKDVIPDDEASEAVNNIINARHAGNVVILVGDCTISYDGRAWSYAEGRHSVIINPSGSVVIHDSESVKAKNWQPKSGVETTVYLNEDNEIVVESVRSNPDEVLSVRFTKLIKSIHYEPADDDIDLKGSEKDMHKYIYNNPSIIHEDFIPKKMEKQVKTGYIDIFGEISGSATVVEVKRKKAQQDSVGQLKRYTDMFENPDGYLVAPSISDPAKAVLRDEHNFEFIRLSPSTVMDEK